MSASHKPQYKKIPAVKISVGQALLILIEQHKNQTTTLNELTKLYFLGAHDNESKNKIKKWLKDKVLDQYEVSEEMEVISEDATRRYFETHLAFHTLIATIKQLDLQEVKTHYEVLKELSGSLTIAAPIIKTFLACQFNDLAQNVNLNSGDHNNIKEYSDLYAKLNVEYAIQKFKAEHPNLKLAELEEKILLIRQEHAENYFSVFSEEDKQKMAFIALSSFITILLNKDIKELPIDLYGKGFYEAIKRGQVQKENQTYVYSNRLGLMKSYMYLPLGDIAASHKPFNYVRVTDRLRFNPASHWAQDNFSYLVHPFSCSISGTMLLHLRVFKELSNRKTLVMQEQDKLIKYLKVFIPLMIFNSGGHTFHEFTYPFRLQEVINSFDFLNFQEMNMETLFLKNNPAFFKALDETILYNKEKIYRAKHCLEIQNYLI